MKANSHFIDAKVRSSGAFGKNVLQPGDFYNVMKGGSSGNLDDDDGDSLNQR